MSRNDTDITVVGLFADCRSAEQAWKALIQHGYPPDCISVIARNGEGPASAEEIERVEEHPPGEDTLAATMAGGVLGGILGLAVGVAAVVLPGSLVVTGPLAGLIGGTALGATAGAVIGSLRELGLSEDDAHGYLTSVEAGAVLVAVQSDEQSFHRPERILMDSGARDIHVVRSGERESSGPE